MYHLNKLWDGSILTATQYRAILSFNTATLNHTAVITKVTLRIKRPATGYLVGNNNPFTWGLGLKADVCKNFFGTTSALQLGDFNFNNAANCKLLAGTFGNTPIANWYSANILNTAFAKINKIGLTQFRLRFAKDDNNDNLADSVDEDFVVTTSVVCRKMRLKSPLREQIFIY